MNLWKTIKRFFQPSQLSMTDLIHTIRLCHEKHIIHHETTTMLEGVIDLAPMLVRDVLIPKSQMVCLKQDADLAEVISVVTQSGHSRFPVLGESSDEIIGILHAKDLLPFLMQAQANFDLYNVLRPAYVIPESKRLLALLNEFRKNRNHLAIVVDEYGSVCGLLTLEDILEQIIGDIEDEFDIEDETTIKDHGQGRYTLKGLTPIDTFNELLTTHLSNEHADTIAGLLSYQSGHLPKRGEMIYLDGFQFKILHADARRIHLIECYDQRMKGPHHHDAQTTHH